MLELIIKRTNIGKEIILVEDSKIVEYYKEEMNQNNKNEGNIYIGVVKDIFKGMQGAFVDVGTEKNSLIHLKDILEKKDEKKEKIELNQDISKLIKPNQKLLVQIKKDSHEKKGARVSTHINLPGKYIVLMPNTDIITVSQKIENQDEQKRLKKLVKDNISETNGAIIRTSSKGKEKEIIDELKKLENKWEKIVESSQKAKDAPQLLYESEDIVEKLLIDLADKEFSRVIVNDSLDYNEISRIKAENDEYKNLQIIVKSEESILDIYDLEQQIKKINNRKIWLKCGGFITIDKTEALTAIDVNTGKYTGNKTMEDTVFKVNKEATIEIAKQLRLRDIGGIIIIDYIDMIDKKDNIIIEELLKEELKKDRAKTQVEGFTKLDLMEMTRKHIGIGQIFTE